jgi:DNA-binding transcriptional ArsR family regulator
MFHAEHVFAALGDPTRLRIVSRLGEQGRLSIARLTRGTRMTRQAVTKHLRVLEDAGIVRNTRQGRENVYELDAERLRQAQQFLELKSKQWNAALQRLRKFVEER